MLAADRVLVLAVSIPRPLWCCPVRLDFGGCNLGNFTFCRISRPATDTVWRSPSAQAITMRPAHWSRA